MSDAPFCNVKGVDVPGSPSLGVVQPIPVAHDLASALKAIRALTNNFNTLANQIPKPAKTGFTNGFTTIKGPETTSAWVEDTGKRVTKKVRVSNPNDASQFVDIEQVNQYTMRNKKTGELFTWKR